MCKSLLRPWTGPLRLCNQPRAQHIQANNLTPVNMVLTIEDIDKTEKAERRRGNEEYKEAKMKMNRAGEMNTEGPEKISYYIDAPTQGFLSLAGCHSHLCTYLISSTTKHGWCRVEVAGLGYPTILTRGARHGLSDPGTWAKLQPKIRPLTRR